VGDGGGDDACRPVMPTCAIVGRALALRPIRQSVHGRAYRSQPVRRVAVQAAQPSVSRRRPARRRLVGGFTLAAAMAAADNERERDGAAVAAARARRSIDAAACRARRRRRQGWGRRRRGVRSIASLRRQSSRRSFCATAAQRVDAAASGAPSSCLYQRDTAHRVETVPS